MEQYREMVLPLMEWGSPPASKTLVFVEEHLHCKTDDGGLAALKKLSGWLRDLLAF